MQIQSQGVSAIQIMQAQQAFQQRKAPQAPATQEQLLPNISAPNADEATLGKQGLVRNHPMKNQMKEIQNIAEQIGLIDVSDQDIQRAYARGESLLTDYRV